MLDCIGADAVTVGCRWTETAADTTAAEVGPLRYDGKQAHFSARILGTYDNRKMTSQAENLRQIYDRTYDNLMTSRNK